MSVILDSGICTVFARRNAAAPGDMPDYEHTLRMQAWYGLLDFETSPTNPTEYRTERETAARIRIHQRRDIHEDDVAVLAAVKTVEDGMQLYKITRAYHGRDDDSGEPITDLTLEEVSAWS